MAEKKKEFTPTLARKLDKEVLSYVKHKEDASALKDICDAENASIKQIMSEYGRSKHIVGDYTISYIESQKKTLNEAKLIELLKNRLNARNLKNLGIIKTIEVIDEDALESAIYNGKISQELVAEMATCNDVSTTVSLRISKAKKKGGDTDGK